eukprot:9293644-Prorocentrum_lima.AAC.1
MWVTDHHPDLFFPQQGQPTDRPRSELVGPLSYMQARSVYGDHHLQLLKPKAFAHMTVREFYESRYCA